MREDGWMQEIVVSLADGIWVTDGVGRNGGWALGF